MEGTPKYPPLKFLKNMEELKNQLEKVNDLLLNANLSFMEKIELKDIKIELERKLGLANNGDYNYEECENCSA